MPTPIETKQAEFTGQQDRLFKAIEEAGDTLDLTKSTTLPGATSADKVAAFRKWSADLDRAWDELQAMATVEKAKQRRTAIEAGLLPPERPTFPGDGPTKSIGEIIVAGESYKHWKANRTFKAADQEIELKTLMETTAGWAPQAIRSGRVVEIATRPIQVIDLIPPGDTDQNAVVYMEETTFTPGAVEIAEGATYGEMALVLTERTSNVRKVGAWLPVTDEQLDDVRQAISFINMRLPFAVRQRLDSQLLVGNGTAPNLRGILNVVGIQTTAKAATEPTFDAAYRAKRLVTVTGRAQPSGYIFHPNDWEAIRLTRTSDGIYLLGSPSEIGPSRLWSLPVAESDAETENTGLCGDFAQFSQLVIRKQIEVTVGYQGTDFIQGRKAVRADIRAAFPVYRPAAFCTITAI